MLLTFAEKLARYQSKGQGNHRTGERVSMVRRAVIRMGRNGGCFTVSDIQSITRMPRHHVAAWMNYLVKRGEVRPTGDFVRNCDFGTPAQFFERVMRR